MIRNSGLTCRGLSDLPRERFAGLSGVLDNYPGNNFMPLSVPFSNRSSWPGAPPSHAGPAFRTLRDQRFDSSAGDYRRPEGDGEESVKVLDAQFRKGGSITRDGQRPIT